MVSPSNGATRAIPIVVVEDIRLLRDRITSMLRAQGFRAVHAARDGEDALQQVRRLRPRLALVDSSVARLYGPTLIEAVRRGADGVHVIVMGLSPAQDDVIAFARAGATGFIIKDATVDEFVATIFSVAANKPVLPPVLAGRLLSYIANERESSRSRVATVRTLTRRERDVIDLIAEGCSNKEIAETLHIAVDTVKTHVHTILDKLGVHTRLQIALNVQRDGERTRGLTPKRGTGRGSSRRNAPRPD